MVRDVQFLGAISYFHNPAVDVLGSGHQEAAHELAGRMAYGVPDDGEPGELCGAKASRSQ